MTDTKNPALEAVYREHHAKRRGEFFLVNGEVRGAVLRVNIGTGKKVLDVGCRDGALTKFYRTGNDVTGVDIDGVALERARETLGITAIQADLNGDWPVEEGVFDAVVACEVIEHLYYPDRVLKKIFTALKPGGVVLGSIPHAFSMQNRMRLLFASKRGTPLQDPTHINHFTVRELRGYLAGAGFTNIKIETIVSRKFKPLSLVFPYAFAHSLMFRAQRPQ